MKIFEIVNKGKGLIEDLLPENLLLIKESLGDSVNFVAHLTDSEAHAGLFANLREWVNDQLDLVIIDSTNIGAITPLSTIPPDINCHGFAVEAGTYTNCGDLIVAPNSIAIITRVNGVWTISQTPFDLSNYVTNDDLVFKADLVVGKNLFNKVANTLIIGKFLNGAGGENIYSQYNISEYIPILPATQYTYSNFGMGGAFGEYYDSNKNFISSFNDSTLTITTPNNATFIRMSIDNSNMNIAQLELGSVATSYENYNLIIKPSQYKFGTVTSGNSTLPINGNDVIKWGNTKLDISIGKNLFNKNSQDIIPNKYLSGQTEVNLIGYNISEYISILPSTQYTYSNFGMGGAQASIYDSNKIFISNFNESTLTITTPNNAAFIRMSIDNSNMDIAQFELGSVATSYENYTNYSFLTPLYNYLPSEEIISVLPKKLYFVKNKELCFYYQNYLLNNLNDSTSVFTSLGINYNRLTKFNFTNTGSGILTTQIVKNLKKGELKNINYEVLNNTSNSGKTINLLFIGDSFTDIGRYITSTKTLLNADGAIVNLIGTCGNSTFKAEGLSGGRMTNTFLDTSSGVAKRVTVSGVSVLPQTGYPGNEYQDDNGIIWQIRGGSISSGNGILNVTRYGATTNDFIGFPNSGTLTKISSGTEGDSVINYTNATSGYFNPFINPSSGLLDLPNYLSSWSLMTPNVIVFQFTWNDIQNWATNNEINLLVSKFKDAVDHVHNSLPNIKIIISIEPFGSVNGNLDWNGKKYSVLHLTKALLSQFEENSSYNTFVIIAPSYACVDLVNGYGNRNNDGSIWTVQPSSKYPFVVETSGGDGVHPNTGMDEIADCIYPIITKLA